jgi:hypothetical protein
MLYCSLARDVAIAELGAKVWREGAVGPRLGFDGKLIGLSSRKSQPNPFQLTTANPEMIDEWISIRCHGVAFEFLTRGDIDGERGSDTKSYDH